MQRILVLAALALAFPAAAVAAPSAGLYGVVTRGPITPVCTVGRPCDAPAAGVVLAFSRPGSLTRRVTTDARGHYRVALRPGVYAVAIARRERLSPARVTVRRGVFARADFELDTGIR
jgi:hypothetical protein